MQYFITRLFVPQASQISLIRRAKFDILLAVPSTRCVCGMEDMMKAYEWMLDHTDWHTKTVGGVWILMHTVRWLAAGCVFGLLFCLGTGSHDYQNTVGAVGAVFALLPGAVYGMAALLGCRKEQ